LSLHGESSSSTSTTLQDSFQKSKRIKYLLEDLPTIEKLQLYCPSLFDSWLCPMCDSFSESFIHIWTCSSVSSIISDIIDSAQSFLISQITSELPLANTKSLCSSLSLTLPYLWSLSNYNSHFNFIDLIKGIIPRDCYNLVFSILHSSSSTSSVLTAWIHFIQSQVNSLIWLPRCDAQISLEKANNISRRSKLNAAKSRCSSSSPSVSSFASSSNSQSVYHLDDFVSNYIRFHISFSAHR
jgi:hypothetical protein